MAGVDEAGGEASGRHASPAQLRQVPSLLAPHAADAAALDAATDWLRSYGAAAVSCQRCLQRRRSRAAGAEAGRGT